MYIKNAECSIRQAVKGARELMEIQYFDGYLMSKDDVLAEIKQGKITTVFNRALLPIYIERTRDLPTWLEKRAIDEHRTNSRLLKKVLRLSEKDNISTTLAVHAVTITDTYWVKPKNSSLTWDDVRFRENYFSSLALRGDLSAFSHHPSRTPELTNIGSFEKCWSLDNGKWWLHKRANQMELFSELFIYHLGKSLGFSMAHYEPFGEDIRSLDFTNGAKTNYEPAYSWMGEDEDYIANYHALKKYGKQFADQYVEMLLMDSYCLNADRHTFNYGILRSVETGECLCMAPNFDNNIALISNGYLKGDRKPDLLGRLLHELEAETGAVSEYTSRHALPIVTHEMIDRCIDAVNIPVDRDYIHRFVMVGYKQTPIYDMAQKQLDWRIQRAEQMAMRQCSDATASSKESSWEMKERG